jgi:lysophospholipase L1-like esterase
MSQTKKKIVAGIVLLQLVIISYFGMNIFNKTRANGQLVVNPIHQDNIIKPENTTLQHFFEPKPNTIEHEEVTAYPGGVYTINSDGLNETQEYSVVKPENTYRIITLGDSFTFGMFVDTNENWTELLEVELNKKMQCKDIQKIEVINLGVKGYDVLYATERYKLRGEKYDPDLVLWFLKEDDINFDNELLRGIVWEILKDLQASGEYEKYRESGELYPEWKLAAAQAYKNTNREQLLELQSARMQNFNNLYNGRLLLFTFTNTPSEEKELMRKYIAGRPYPSFFYENIMTAEMESDLFVPNDGHPTEKGHREIADRLYKYIAQNKVISCP